MMQVFKTDKPNFKTKVIGLTLIKIYIAIQYHDAEATQSGLVGMVLSGLSDPGGVNQAWRAL